MLIISRTEIAFKEITNSKLFLWLVNLKIFLSNKEILVLYNRHFDKKKMRVQYNQCSNGQQPIRMNKLLYYASVDKFSLFSSEVLRYLKNQYNHLNDLKTSTENSKQVKE